MGNGHVSYCKYTIRYDNFICIRYSMNINQLVIFLTTIKVLKFQKKKLKTAFHGSRVEQNNFKTVAT